MRSIHLLLVLAFVLISTAAASASDQPAQASDPVSLLTTPKVLSSGLNLRVDLYRLPSNLPTWEIKQRGRRIIARDPERDSTCYTMRSYLVVRDEPGSDATHSAGYTTCLRGSQFDVKDAVLTVGAEEDR
jgi:hypothetical protein